MHTWLSQRGHWLAGVGGIIYGLLEIVNGVAVDTSAPLSQQVTSPVLQRNESIQMIALILLALGLVSIYFRLPKSSTLRTIGFLLAFAGTQLAVGLLWSGAFLLPYLGNVVPNVVDGFITAPPAQVQFGLLLGNFLFGIGWIVFAIAQIGVGDGSRLAWGILSIAMLLFLPLPWLGGLLFALAFAWIAWSYRQSLE